MVAQSYRAGALPLIISSCDAPRELRHVGDSVRTGGGKRLELRACGAWSSSSFSKQQHLVDRQHPLISTRSEVVTASTDQKADQGWGMDDTTTTTGSAEQQLMHDGEEFGHPMFSDQLLSRSQVVFEILRQCAFRIRDEVELKIKLRKTSSKKPHRLSTTSSDLLD